MFCTPTYMFVDRNLWAQPMYFSYMMGVFQNYTPGQPYDCGLKVLPCPSPLASSLVFPDDWGNYIYWYDMIVVYICTTLLVILGVVGNVFNVVIFAKNNIANESTNSLLLATALSDLVNSLLNIPLIVVYFLCFFDVATALTTNTLYPHFIYFGSNWLGVLSLDFITVLAVQRAGAVLIPFKAATVFSPKIIKITVTVLVFICIATSTPFFFTRTPKYVYHPYFNKEVALGYYFDSPLPITVRGEYSIRYMTTRSIVNISIIGIAVTITILKLITQGKNRAGLKEVVDSKSGTSNNKLSTMNERERKTMKMSLAVCTSTFIIYLSQIIGSSLMLQAFKVWHKAPLMPFIHFACSLFMAAFSSFNFFLYLIVSPQFREAFNKIFSKSS